MPNFAQQQFRTEHVSVGSNPEVGGENANVARLSLAVVFDRPSSECFDGQRKHVADAAFGQDDARRIWIGLQFAAQP
jgi:hypothetical protein